MKQDAINALHELAGEAQDNGNSSVWIARRVEMIKAALKSAPAVEPAQAVPVAWRHDCAALLTNDVELWINACPHCGKPRTTKPAPLDSDTREAAIMFCYHVLDTDVNALLRDSAKDLLSMLEAGNE